MIINYHLSNLFDELTEVLIELLLVVSYYYERDWDWEWSRVSGNDKKTNLSYNKLNADHYNQSLMAFEVDHELDVAIELH